MTHDRMGVTLSPVLVGRDDLVALAQRRWAAAAQGSGGMLLLAGEAGIGKTRLLGDLERHSVASGATVVRAGAFPRDLELTGALFEDLARGLARTPEPARQALATDLGERLRPVRAPRGDAHRRRRLLVLDLAQLVVGLGDTNPTVLSLEDLHWADDLTLEVLFHAARGIRSRPLLIVGTYRNDELYPRIPMREWRTRLLGQRLAEEARLERLDPAQVGQMAEAIMGGDLPPSREVVGRLHDRSDGIPLHVEELLGAMRVTSTSAGTPLGRDGVPDTLADAILQRMRPLSDSSRRVAVAAAVIGRAFELDLLARTLEVGIEDLAEPLTELQQRFVIVPTADGHGYRFRHALICDAVYEDTSLAVRRTLHGRVADAIASTGPLAADSTLSAHFEHAGRRPEAYQRAMLAAVRAAGLSAHREALSLYQRALANLDPQCPPSERAVVLIGIAAEAAATDDNVAAAERYREAISVLAAAGRPLAAAELVPRLVAARHLLGDDLAARVSVLERALADLDRMEAPAEGEPDPERVRADLLAALAAAYMLDRRLPPSIQYGEAAMELAERSSAAEAKVDIASTLASVLVFAGRVEEGWRLHAATIERAREQRLEAEAARSYRMAGTCASVLVEYLRAEAWLREGVEYAERVELWNHRHYMAAHLAHVAWATGDIRSAEDIAAHVLADGRGGITTRITALYVLGYVALVRGDWQRAESLLGEARLLGDDMGELQRFSPPLWGLAEVALLRGNYQQAVKLTARGFEASHAVEDAAYLFPFLVTGTRARLAAADPLEADRWVAAVAADLEARSIPGTLPAIAHARGLLALAAGTTGEASVSLVEAEAGWISRRRAWEGAWAAIDLAWCAVRTNRPSWPGSRSPVRASGRCARRADLAGGRRPRD